MYSSQVEQMYNDLQLAIEKSDPLLNHKPKIMEMPFNLANYADDLEFENTKYKLQR